MTMLVEGHRQLKGQFNRQRMSGNPQELSWWKSQSPPAEKHLVFIVDRLEEAKLVKMMCTRTGHDRPL